MATLEPLGSAFNIHLESFLNEVRILAARTVILHTPKHLEAYRDPFSVNEQQDGNRCSAVLQPDAVTEIQTIVRLASKYQVPLWTISQGKNNGYGGPAPRMSGCVIVELQRMKRILKVDDKLCTALVEPGVTFFELYNYCCERGLKVYPSVPSIGWGSIVGNALDRGIGYTPLGDHAAAQCGIEVVLPSGDLLRTGMGAISGSSTWQCFKGGYGPSVESLFSQSSLGIVTKLGIWLAPKQPGFMSCTVDVPNEDDLEQMADILGDLYRKEVLQNHPVVGNVVRYLARTAPRSHFYTGEGAIPDEILEKIQKEAGIGFWNARFALYGTEAMMKARWAEITDAFSVVKGAKLGYDIFLASAKNKLLDASEVPITEAGGTQIGIPNMLRLQSIKYRGANGGHISFSPVVPTNGRAIKELYYVGKARAAEFGYDFHAGIHIFPRHTIHLNLIYFDADEAEERKAVAQCFEALLKDARALGYSEYRAHLEWMDLVCDQYDFNNHALRRFNETLKDAIDPAGILSPGKQGIWPKRFRVQEPPATRAVL